MEPFGPDEDLDSESPISYFQEGFSCYASFPFNGSNSGLLGKRQKAQLPELLAFGLTKDFGDESNNGKQETRASKNEQKNPETKIKSSAAAEALNSQTDKEKQWSQEYNKNLERALSGIKKSLVEPLEKNFEKYGIGKEAFASLGIGFSMPASESAAAHFSHQDNKIYFYYEIMDKFDPKKFEEEKDSKSVKFIREITAHELAHYVRFNLMSDQIKRINDVEESFANMIAGVTTRTKEEIAENYSKLNEKFMSESVEELPYMVGYAAAYALLSMGEEKRTETIKNLLLEEDQTKSMEKISSLALESGLVKGEELNSIIKGLPKIQGHIHGADEQIPKKEIREIINSSNPYLIGLLAENSKLPKYFRKMLENSGEDFVKIILIKNQEIDTDEQAILARHSSENVKMSLAGFWGLDPGVQLGLFNEANPKILEKLAKNPSISEEVQELIAKQDDASLQLLLLKNLYSSDISKISNSKMLVSVLSKGKKSSEQSEKAIEYLSESKNEIVRSAFAVAVSLKNDFEENKDLVQYQIRFAEDESLLVRSMLAMSPGLSEQAFLKLLSDKEPIVLASLAENFYLDERKQELAHKAVESAGIDLNEETFSSKFLRYIKKFDQIQSFLF